MGRKTGKRERGYPLKSILLFYINGFKSMTLGKTLWKIIAIKLVIIFLVFKLFFFPDILQKHFKDQKERAEHVMDVLTYAAKSPTGHEKILSKRGGHL